jgi:isocitrate/isopropylmalate dehydrogenase
MMLDYLGEKEQSARLRTAVESCIAAGEVTPDLGGILTTSEMTRAAIQRL